MNYLSVVEIGAAWGIVLQYALSGLLALGNLAALRMFAERYTATGRGTLSPYLYLLLLPCILVVWTAGEKQRQNLPDTLSSALYQALWMAMAMAVFLIVAEMFHKICQLSLKDREAALLSGQIKKYENYLEEADDRETAYRSFQHDVNNHFLVLKGLLEENNLERAKKYLEKLHIISSVGAPRIKTGNMVLDVLIRDKLMFAKQMEIRADCQVHIPEDSEIDDTDLCILFANALDNAVTACLKAEPEKRYLQLRARRKQGFLLFELFNGTRGHHGPVVFGTGLRNIEATAKKYGGVVQIEESDDEFRLSALLCCRSRAEESR